MNILWRIDLEYPNYEWKFHFHPVGKVSSPSHTQNKFDSVPYDLRKTVLNMSNKELYSLKKKYSASVSANMFTIWQLKVPLAKLKASGGGIPQSCEN